MTIERNEKPTWFGLIDKIKAIRLMNYGSGSELATFLDCPYPRISEWVNGHKEPKAEIVLRIQEWIKIKEQAIFRNTELSAQYKKIVQHIRKK